MLSAFGIVKLVNQTASDGNDNANDTLIAYIEMKLFAASQDVANEVVNITVVELEGDPGETILCHYEILLNITSPPSSSLLNALALNDSTTFEDGAVAFRGKISCIKYFIVK